jgi:DNA topoisomerase-2
MKINHLTFQSDEPKTIRRKRNVSDYTSITLHQQIYSSPDTYIGSVDKEEREEWIFDLQSKNLIKTIISLPQGIERCYLEPLSNAGDNVEISRRMGVDPGKIIVTMNLQYVSIKNEGEPIPLYPKGESETPKYVVDDIFGTLLTSSNYDNKIIRMGCGKNGYGIKLTNIFSKYMVVKCGDSKNKQEWTGIWKNNMLEKVSSVVIPGHIWDGTKWISKKNEYKGKSYVEVIYTLDFNRFGYKEYPLEAISLFHRYLLDFGFTCKVPVVFNGVEYNVQDIKNYAKLYWPSDVIKKSLIHFENDEIEAMYLDTPNNGFCLSFVNGLMTQNGGVHVNEAYNAISSYVLDKVNSLIGKQKEKDAIANKMKLSKQDLKQHISLILSCRLPDPKYTSQSKTTLSYPKPSIKIEDKELKIINKWNLLEYLYMNLQSKFIKVLKRDETKTRKRVFLDKGEWANEAGGNRSKECILYIVEGKSASSYPKKRIDLTVGKDFGGYYPLKGKLLNILKATPLQIAKNTEISDIKKILGIKEGIDYSLPENINTLNYGFIICNTDADTDGIHIRSLLIALFNSRYKSILKNGMFGYLATFAVKLFNKDKVVERFVTVEDYENWEKDHPKHKYTVKYYKGLGTCRDSDIKDDCSSASVIVCVYDDDADKSVNLAFGPNKSDNRKEWINKWRNATKIDDIIEISVDKLIKGGFSHQYHKKQIKGELESEIKSSHPIISEHHIKIDKLIKGRNISDIINKDLITYTIDALFRALPGEDGLKKSQRQILYYVLTNWDYGNSSKGSMKVDRIASQAAELTNYHHGQASMVGTIIRMTQNFVSSNNLNFFKQEGQFGTRSEGGEDAAEGRYSETCPEWWIKYVIKKEIVDLVPRRKVEGENAEPVWIPIDIPIHIINGFEGIATGFSTWSPGYNPYDVIKYLIDKCHNKQTSPIYPAYKGFRGEIIIVDKKKENNVETSYSINSEYHKNTDEMPKEDDDSSKIMITKGNYKILNTYEDGSSDIQITELPIGKWTHPYHKWLELLQKENKIARFRDNSTTETVNFTIFNFKETVNHKNLNLIRTYSLNNIILIDNDGYPKKYSDITECLDKYYIKMIDIYKQYKRYKIKKHEEVIKELKLRYKFITYVLESKIVVFKKKKSNIYSSMDEYNIPHYILDKVKLSEFTEDNLTEIKKELEKSEKKLLKIKIKNSKDMWVKRLSLFYNALIEHNYIM